jgi:hypothetical protein
VPDDSRDGGAGNAIRQPKLLHNAHHRLAFLADFPYEFQRSSISQAGSRKRRH